MIKGLSQFGISAHTAYSSKRSILIPYGDTEALFRHKAVTVLAHAKWVSVS